MSNTSSDVTPIFTDPEWTPELLDEITKAIKVIADEELGLSYYPMQIRIITSEQMLDAYSSVGMPVGYAHWSFGKRFLMNQRAYQSGDMGLAYEIVINTDPCLVYCMEDNTMTMQTLVIAHAGFGHNAFFKNNYLFHRWTHADGILDYLLFAKNFVSECEEKYGIEEVSYFLDACHALQMYGVDRFKRPAKLSFVQEKAKMQFREEETQKNLNVLYRTLPPSEKKDAGNKRNPSHIDSDGTKINFPKEPEENILYFIEKHAPHMPTWKREIIRIVRKVGQYFYPQRQTQVMNEGFACFTHYYIMTRLQEKGLVTEGAYQEFLISHTNVVFQPEYDETRKVTAGKDDEGRPIIKEVSIYSGINPYALGFAMYMDIKRICEHPTDEDRKWFPDIAGTPWLPAILYAMENFKDESFILQYLSPHLIRKFRLFAIRDDDMEEEIEVSAIHDDDGYQSIREKLSAQYDLGVKTPNIQVVHVDVRGTRELVLEHHAVNRRPLDAEATEETLFYLRELWEYPVKLESFDEKRRLIDSWAIDEMGDLGHIEGELDLEFLLSKT